MDTAGWIAVAGILGTLLGTLGTLLSPLLGERMRRNSVRTEHVLTRQLDVYADLLRATASLADNAVTWSTFPLADLKELDDAEMDRLVSEARVVASDEVYARFTEFASNVHKFNHLLNWTAKPAHQRARNEGKGDSGEAIATRMQLGGIADELRAQYKKLESTIRGQVKP